ncbi:MAG: EAL domain-containing protein [Roseburia sp.]|nr:EAL domain-containing protein [Roseburia sp.]
MNIQMQMGGLFIMLLLLWFYSRQETLGLYTERLFKRAMYVTVSCLVLDIVSVFLIVNQDKYPLWLVRFECKTYLLSLLWSGYMALAYASADIHQLTRADRFVHGAGILTAVMSVIIYILPIEIFYDGDKIVYTYGMACMATYAGALALIVTTIVKIGTQGKTMNPKRRSAIRLWLVIWSIAAVVQFLNNKLLLVGFAGVIGMVILFFELENPEGNIDRKTGFFNRYAFVEFVRQRYRAGLNSCGMLVALEDAHAKDVPQKQIEAAMIEIAQFMRRVPEARVFSTEEREFSLAFENKEALDRAYHMICDRFRHGWLADKAESALFLQPRYVLLPSGSVAKSPEEMLGFLKYFRAHCADAQDTYALTVDEASVGKKRAREEMLETLVWAMEEDHVEVFFQPIYATHEKKFVSAEALVRIRREDGSIIPPGLFIPIAEETGLISRLGEIVFDKTCRFIQENDVAQYGIEYIEVNLSVVQCEDTSLAKMYIDVMERYKLDPKYINLEITESASVIVKRTLLENMQMLLDYGVTFSLDDFGNGQSNLNYIVDLPVQIVKFDRDMTQAYFENEKAQFVLRATMDMVHDMHLKVVSEGVETAQQLEKLEELGIDYIQGYYFSKPIEASAFIDFLKAKN